MKVFYLHRLPSTDQGTHSVLVDERGLPVCNMLECPWKDNLPMVSSVPLGEYIVRRVHHEKFGETFILLDVLNRDGIYMHKANFASEIHGCLAFGMGYTETPDGIVGVSGSSLGKDRFMEKMKGENEAKLVIQECRGKINGN